MIRIAEQRLFWLLLGGALLIGTIWKASPMMVNYFYRAVGYDDLQQALAILEDEYPGPDFCVTGGVENAAVVKLLEQAVTALEKAREANPADAQTWLLLGRGNCLLGRLEAAGEAYERFSVLRPGNPLGFLEGGFVYEEECLKIGEMREILPGWTQCQRNTLRQRIYSEWKATEVESQFFVDKGNEFVAVNNAEAALQWFSWANFLDSKLISPFLRSGQVYNKVNQWNEAIVFFHEALRLQPDQREAWYGLGVAYEGLSMAQEALASYEAALPGAGEIGASSIWFHIGYLKQYAINPVDPGGAWIAYDSALAANGFNGNKLEEGNTYFQRGILLMDQSRWEEAALAFQEALPLLPNHYRLRLQIAKTYLQLSRLDEAANFLQEAIGFQPDNKSGYLLLGEVYFAQQNFYEALNAYEKVLELDPQNKKAQEAIEDISAILPSPN